MNTYTHIIKQCFPRLNNNDVNILNRYLSHIISYIKYKSIFQSDIDLQLQQNNHQDTIGLLFMLIPFIKKDHMNITSINDIYITKDEQTDINKNEPKYTYSNIQYDKCTIDANNHATEIPFNEQHLQHNCNLLKDTIQTISNKLYVNWINVRPIKSYTTTNIYRATKKKLDKYKYRYNNPTNNVIPNKPDRSLFIGDIYNTINTYLFDSIKNIKILIYDVMYNAQNTQYIVMLQNELPITTCLNNIPWSSLSSTITKEFENKWNSFRNSPFGNTLLVFFNKYYKKPVSIENIYEYIRTILQKFKSTWYSTFYIRSNIFVTNMTLVGYTPKNIYNYAKLFVQKPGGARYESYGVIWSALIREEKNIMVGRLNNRALGGYVNVRNNLVDIIFQTMMFYGLLSVVTYEQSLTNSLYLPTDDTEKNTSIRRLLQPIIPTYKNSNYYLTNAPYGNLFIDDTNYLDYIVTQSNKQDWPGFYALDWISQLSWFHRYLHSNIMFVTGGTGVGKSTQVPKLLLYSLKMIDWNQNGKVACTQPRVNATTDNANRVSLELGVPIIKTKNKKDENDDKTKNYSVQYQYKDGNHIPDQNDIAHVKNYLTLKIQTDGTLYTELKNIFLKSGQSKNKYDAIIIDEAHEHNPNMDMILTKLLHTIYFNKSVKLVIVSATMDEDEHIFRRFFRKINDNERLPKNNIGITRDFIDRRVHIEKPFPKKSTRFAIKEHYMEFGDHKDIVNDILKTSSDGDILIFQSGSKEIRDLVEELNNNTPSDILVLPYFSEMGDNKIGKVRELNKYEFTIPKSIVFSDNYDITKIIQVPKGTYKRAIIVATNIAEASITIPTLKYVIDDGNQKVGEYDYVTREYIIKSTKITNANRLQRRGRVGRLSDGVVYYLYKEGSLPNIKKKYPINSIDLTDIYFDLLKNTNTITNDITIRNKIINIYSSDNIVGFDKPTIEDIDGLFYIIHPDEYNIKRNIVGVPQNSINLSRMQSYWITSKERQFIDNNYDKTPFGIHFYDIGTIFGNYYLTDVKLVLFYIYCIIYGCDIYANKLLPMILALQKNSIFLTDMNVVKYYKSNSDCGSLLLLINDLPKTDIEEHCSRKGINYTVIKKYINLESEFSKMIDDKKNMAKLAWFKTIKPVIVPKDYNDAIVCALIHAYYANIYKLFDVYTNKSLKTGCYFDIYNPRFNSVYNIKKNTRTTNETFVTGYPNYILSMNMYNRKLSNIHEVDVKVVGKLLGHIYKNKVYDINAQKKSIVEELKNEDEKITKNMKNVVKDEDDKIDFNGRYYVDKHSIVNNYLAALNDVRRDFL